MANQETPISKYIASLERRQALLTPSPAPDSAAIFRKINFEDTYFHGGDQSILQGQGVTPSPDPRHVAKRRRLSILGESLEDEENQSKRLSDLERLLQQTQGELIEARAMNVRLEHQISQIKHAHAEKMLNMEKSEHEMRMRMREASDKVVLLKEQVDKLTKKEAEVLERLHKQTELHCEKVKSIEDKLRNLETENLELRGKFESGSLKQTDELRKLNASLEETEMGAEKWVMETQLLRDQLELKDQQLRKYQNELKESQVLACKYHELKAKYDYSENTEGSTEQLQEKLKHFENLFAMQKGENIKLMQKMEKISDENRMLRSSMNKEMLLEEQISAFEEEVRALRGAMEEKGVLEAEKEGLQSQVSAWRTMAFKLDPDCTGPAKLESYIRRIQNQLLEARHEASTLKLTIADKDRNIAKKQAEISSLQQQVKTLSSEKENLTQELKKTTRRLVLVTKDRDGLKDLKESYEQEFEGVISKPLQERVNQLEATVAEYEAIIQEDPSKKKSCGDCEKRMALISEIQTEMDRLKTEKSEVETKLANMSAMGASIDEGNTTGVKIVSLGVNPSALSVETRLEEAIKENQKLKEKIKELQERTVDESSIETGESLKELEERNKNLERRLSILSEAYDFETQQLQLIVNKLCGFHFTLVREPSVQIRLSSVYSHERNDTFIFQENSNGDMLLLESPILDSFRDDIERFLIRDGSIPGFLSSVTITYVQNQHSQDASQLPSSQQSTAEDETTTASVSVRDPREVQVEVTRQRHPTINDPEEEDEEVEGDDEEEDGDDEDEDVEEHDDGMEGDELEEEDERYEEEEEEEGPHDDDDDEEDEDEESPPPAPSRRGQLVRAPPRRPPPPDDDSDSDVIMIDD